MRQVQITLTPWIYKEPFVLTGRTMTQSELLYVTITENGITGRGESVGVFYTNDRGGIILERAMSVKAALEQGVTRQELQGLLPSGGARNAIDCALWDLEAKQTGKTIWQLLNITPKPVHTVNTISINTPGYMAAKAKLADTAHIKVKLNDEMPLERITAVCEARPDATIVVDANQGWTFNQLQDLAPKFKALGVKMIEQPLPRGKDDVLANYNSPIVLCGDESCLDTSELEQAAKNYQMINVKLDKTGGLTEALKLVKAAKAKGVQLMVGNMVGTSLAMAPGFVVAQFCDFVDLDGALFLTKDRQYPMSYANGVVSGLRPELWG
ncbi:dipeptide epimerase [uncultured Microscilla sp.]|uniref:dipeptide epimerase n=1 Tax=uncultured Microscilla sp. TaxID=432653 RepID=UPI00263A00B6|nr:dipeptide epimerase [uncultured Microscilla sp.]